MANQKSVNHHHVFGAEFWSFQASNRQDRLTSKSKTSNKNELKKYLKPETNHLWMTPNLYIKIGCFFTKHQSKTGCEEFQVYISIHTQSQVVPF